MRGMGFVSFCLGAGLVMMPAAAGFADNEDVVDRVYSAREVYKELTNVPDRETPDQLLEGCRCIAVIPHVVKGAFIVGARYGKGVVSCRDAEGKWSPPAFLTIGGGSLGLQLGGQATDLVLFIMSEKGAKSLLKSEFTIGGDVSGAAGPVGRTASATTDIRLTADIYSYSRAKGLFAGISLEGASLTPDDKAIREFYGEPFSPEDILFKHQVPTLPKAAQYFVDVLP